MSKASSNRMVPQSAETLSESPSLMISPRQRAESWHRHRSRLASHDNVNVNDYDVNTMNSTTVTSFNDNKLLPPSDSSRLATVGDVTPRSSKGISGEKSFKCMDENSGRRLGAVADLSSIRGVDKDEEAAVGVSRLTQKASPLWFTPPAFTAGTPPMSDLIAVDSDSDASVATDDENPNDGKPTDGNPHVEQPFATTLGKFSDVARATHTHESKSGLFSEKSNPVSGFNFPSKADGTRVKDATGNATPIGSTATSPSSVATTVPSSPATTVAPSATSSRPSSTRTTPLMMTTAPLEGGRGGRGSQVLVETDPRPASPPVVAESGGYPPGRHPNITTPADLALESSVNNIIFSQGFGQDSDLSSEGWIRPLKTTLRQQALQSANSGHHAEYTDGSTGGMMTNQSLIPPQSQTDDANQDSGAKQDSGVWLSGIKSSTSDHDGFLSSILFKDDEELADESPAHDDAGAVIQKIGSEPVPSEGGGSLNLIREYDDDYNINSKTPRGDLGGGGVSGDLDALSFAVVLADVRFVGGVGFEKHKKKVTIGGTHENPPESLFGEFPAEDSFPDEEAFALKRLLEEPEFSLTQKFQQMISGGTAAESFSTAEESHSHDSDNVTGPTNSDRSIPAESDHHRDQRPDSDADVDLLAGSIGSGVRRVESILERTGDVEFGGEEDCSDSDNNNLLLPPFLLKEEHLLPDRITISGDNTMQTPIPPPAASDDIHERMYKACTNQALATSESDRTRTGVVSSTKSSTTRPTISSLSQYESDIRSPYSDSSTLMLHRVPIGGSPPERQIDSIDPLVASDKLAFSRQSIPRLNLKKVRPVEASKLGAPNLLASTGRTFLLKRLSYFSSGEVNADAPPLTPLRSAPRCKSNLRIPLVENSTVEGEPSRMRRNSEGGSSAKEEFSWVGHVLASWDAFSFLMSGRTESHAELGLDQSNNNTTTAESRRNGRLDTEEDDFGVDDFVGHGIDAGEKLKPHNTANETHNSLGTIKFSAPAKTQTTVTQRSAGLGRFCSENDTRRDSEIVVAPEHVEYYDAESCEEVETASRDAEKSVPAAICGSNAIGVAGDASSSSLQHYSSAFSSGSQREGDHPDSWPAQLRSVYSGWSDYCEKYSCAPKSSSAGSSQTAERGWEIIVTPRVHDDRFVPPTARLGRSEGW